MSDFEHESDSADEAARSRSSHPPPPKPLLSRPAQARFPSAYSSDLSDDPESPIPQPSEPYPTSPTSSSSPKKKSRRRGPDPSADADPADPVQAEIAEIAKEIATARSVKYDQMDTSESTWDEKARGVLNRMQVAVDSDQRSFDLGQPPFARLKLVRELTGAIANRHLHRALMRSHFLNACGAFICPFRTKSGEEKFPERTLIKDMLTLLDKLEVTSDNLENLTGDESIVRVISGLPDYGREIEYMRQNLIQKWQRKVVVNDEDSEDDSMDEGRGGRTKRRKPLFDRDALKQERKELSAEPKKGINSILDARLEREICELKLRKAPGVAPPQEFQPPPRFLDVPKPHARRKPEGSGSYRKGR